MLEYINLFYFLCFLVVTDWTPILTDSDRTVCLDRPYLGRTVWLIQKFTTAYFLSSCLESEALSGSYLFLCYSEINGSHV